MAIVITKYNSICNLGSNIDEIFNNALCGCANFTIRNDIIKNKNIPFGNVDSSLLNINTRCINLVLTALKDFEINKNDSVVVATTNSSIEDYAITQNLEYANIGYISDFIKQYYKLSGLSVSVSTACSSGIKAFSIAKRIIQSKISDRVIVIAVDSFTKAPVYGFDALNILSTKISQPFSKNRDGINIGEGTAVFFVENSKDGIEIAGIGENTDSYHSTSPNPNGQEAISAIRKALKEAKITPKDVDYINLHGTGTMANDLMEGNAIFDIFKDSVPASSTKPLTGHCLGAAAGIETALCCKLLESGKTKLFPHVYDGIYDKNIPKIRLTDDLKIFPKVCLNTSFGFGGTNCAMILRKI